MKTTYKTLTVTWLIVSILFLSCQQHPTRPQKGEVAFKFKFAFAENMPESHFMYHGYKNISGTENKLSKSALDDAVDMGHVMVLDFSAYADMQEFYNSEEFNAYHEAVEKIEEDSLNSWSQWVSLFNESFSIAADQQFSITGDTAFVTVTGVPGLNYILVALTENNQIMYTGENHTHGEEESQEDIYIYLYRWQNYAPPEEEPAEEPLFEVITTIPVGKNPDIPVLSSDDAYLYVVNQSDSSISVISTASYSVIATLNTGWWPQNPAITPDGNFVYVPVENSSRIDVISTTTNTIVDTIILGGYLENEVNGVAFTPDGEIAFATSDDSKKGSFIQINEHELLTTITFGDSPRKPVAGPNSEFFYVSDYIADQLHVISARNQSVHTSIDIGSFSHEPTLTPDGLQLWVADEYDDNISVIDVNSLTLTQTITVGKNPQRGAFTSDGTYYICPNLFDNTVSIIETATLTVVKTINIGSDPYEGSVSRDNQYAFIPCWNDGVISVISIPDQSFVENITCGTSPQKPVIASDGTIYTTNYNSNNVSVIRKQTF